MGKKKLIRISDLPFKTQESIRAQVGDAHFAKIVGSEGKGRRNKYGVSAAEERTVDGIVFDSKFEARSWVALRDALGESKVARQVPFILQEGFRADNGEKIRDVTWVADFVIGAPGDPLENKFVCDAKGMRLSEYKLKRKLFIAKYRVPIYELKNVGDIQDLIGVVTGRLDKSSICRLTRSKRSSKRSAPTAVPCPSKDIRTLPAVYTTTKSS